MKTLINLISLIIFICGQVAGQKSNGFELQGNIEGLVNGTSVYLVTRDIDTIGSAKSIGSQFTFKGRVEGDANFYFLRLDSNVSKELSNVLWLVNSSLNISGTIKQFNNLKLSGSDAQLDWEEFKLIQDSTPDNKLREMNMAFVKTHPNSLFTPYIIKQDLEESFNILTDRAKNSYTKNQMSEHKR